MDCVSSANKAERLDVEALSELLGFLSERACVISTLRWNQNDSATVARSSSTECAESVHRLTLAFTALSPSLNFEDAVKSQCQKHWQCDYLELSRV